MGDPLSATASAITVITVGLSASKQITQTYQSMRGAREDILALCSSNDTLRKTLDALQRVLEREQATSRAATSAQECILQCRSGLQKLTKKLEKVARLSSDPAVLSIRIYLRYAFREATVAKLNTTIHQDLLSHLLIALETLNVETTLSIRNDIQNLRNGLENTDSLPGDLGNRFDRLDLRIESISEAAEIGRREEQRSKVIAWVAPNDIVGDFHNTASGKHEPGTGEWFLRGERYRQWQQQIGNFLWIHGSPGCGKTVLCSSIISETVQFCSLRQNTQFAYFYFSFGDERRQQTENCVRALLRQLLTQRQLVPDGVLDIYKKYRYSFPPLSALQSALRSIIAQPYSTYIVIDALDECPSHNGERAVLLSLIGSLQSSASLKANLLVTSRKIGDIEAKLTPMITCAPIGIEEEDINADIRKHVKAQLLSDDTMSRWSEAIKLEVENVLTTKAHGIYLDALRRCPRPSAVKRTLQTLPRTLDETYERILLNIDESLQSEAQLALIWLVASRRELTVQELAEAAVMDVESEIPIDPEDRLFDPDRILDILSGLIYITKSKEEYSPRYIPPRSLVRLAHFSVEEFLVSDRLANSQASKFHVAFQLSQIKLTRACLKYMSWSRKFLEEQLDLIDVDVAEEVRSQNKRLNVPPPPSYDFGDVWYRLRREERFILPPLYDYTYEFWHDHLRRCQDALPQEELMRVVVCLESPSLMRDFEARAYSRKDIDAEIYCCAENRCGWTRNQNGFIEIKTREISQTPMYYAAFLGLLDLVKALLEIHCQRQLCGDGLENPIVSAEGNELSIACLRGHDEIVQLLINAKVWTRVALQRKENILVSCMRSTRVNPETVLELLNSFGPELHCGIGSGWTLHWAAEEGHTRVAEKLLSMISRSSRNNYAWTSAHYSSNARWIHGDVRPSYEFYGSAPYTAARLGQVDILALMIADWNNIGEQDGEGRTALYWAAFHGHLDVVKLLLEHGAAPQGHSEVPEWTPEYWARTFGYPEIERLL